MLSMIMQRGVLLLDRGLTLLRDDRDVIRLSAVTGWTGRPIDSFNRAPIEIRYLPTIVIEKLLADPSKRAMHSNLNAELAVRMQPGFFHLVPAIQSMVPEEDWPDRPYDVLFIATPQLGIESELVELSLLESLVAEAATGDAQAQLLLAHIEEECAAPIAEVISAQKSRLDQMLEDQAAQLRIHAEAVNRAEQRGRLKAAAVDGSSEGAASSIGSTSSSSASASALAPSSAASASAPSVCAVSFTALSSASSGSPSAAFSESAVAYSWTASKAYASLASVCTAGRAKYKTITSAALRFLRFASESDQSSSLGANVSKRAPLTIADILAAKRARMQRMIDEQLLIHAEAVERAESRRRINADRVAGDASVSPASALAGSSSSALAPTSAASSTSSSRSNSVGVGPASACLSSAGSSSLVSAFAAADTDGSPYSWTSSFKTLESMREPGRKQYRIITSAALRFLHTLRPVSVNRSGGSHTVFHFASGKPVTLVQPHGGDGSVSRHKATRLYAVLHEAVLQQLSPAEALPAAGSGRRAALTEAAH